MRDLVLIHGRAQEHKDSKALKAEWIENWSAGLAASGLQVPLPDDRIHFPYYGDTLEQLTAGLSPDDAAKIVVRGQAPGDANDMSPEEKAFIEAALMEIVGQCCRGEDAEAVVRATLPQGAVVERGVLNWGWVQAIAEVLDRKVPGASAASVALATRDVYQYLSNDVIRGVIDAGAASAIPPGRESVVVSHSLGTVVAYNVLRNTSVQQDWKVPLFVTLGSPLAVTVIKQKLARIQPMRYPRNVDSWFNALDPDDIVALFPLDRIHFPLNPPIENLADVQNKTANQHGISGYLGDPVVARRIYEAVLGDSAVLDG